MVVFSAFNFTVVVLSTLNMNMAKTTFFLPCTWSLHMHKVFVCMWGKKVLNNSTNCSTILDTF